MVVIITDTLNGLLWKVNSVMPHDAIQTSDSKKNKNMDSEDKLPIRCIKYMISEIQLLW